MNEIIEVETRPVAAALPERVIILQTEIKALHKQYQALSVSYAVEIGRRLREAKELLPHGAWGAWLRDNVDFSQRTAGDLMRMFEQYGADQQGILGAEVNSQAIANLTVTQAVRLLSLPEDEREEVAREAEAQGMTTRELEQAIRERDEARKRAEDAEAGTKKAEEQREVWRKDAEIAREKVRIAESEKKKQIEAAEKKAAELERRLTEAQKAPPAPAKQKESPETAELKRKLAEAQAEAERLQRELKASDAAVAEFKVYFDGMQQQAAKMMEMLTRMEPEKADKLRKAVLALLGQMQAEVGAE